MNPNDFGKKYLTDQCQKISISEFLNMVKCRMKESLLNYEINSNGLNIRLSKSKTGFGGTRFWFTCPICNKRIGVLYRHPTSQILGCRKCLKLDYRKRKFKGMIENSNGN